MPAERGPGGLVSVPVGPQHVQVEFFYMPSALRVGAWISGGTLVLCLAGLWAIRRQAASRDAGRATDRDS
jgi:hypothetical protein